MSNRKTPRVSESLQSSDKLTLFKANAHPSEAAIFWGAVFQHPTFVRAAVRALNLQGEPFRMVVGSEDVGYVALISHRRKTIKTVTLPLLFQYFGPMFYEDHNQDHHFLQFDRYLASICDFAYFSMPPMWNETVAYGTGWTCIQKNTLVFTKDRLRRWGSDFLYRVRKKIKIARREKVEISLVDTVPKGLWSASYARRDTKTPIAEQTLIEWCEALVEDSLIKIFAAHVEGKAVAFRGQLIYRGYAYDWVGGSDPAYHPLGVNQLLMAEIGDQLSKSDVHTWDLVGGDIESIAEFKRSFGAIDTPHCHIHKSYNMKGRLFELMRSIKHGRR